MDMIRSLTQELISILRLWQAKAWPDCNLRRICLWSVFLGIYYVSLRYPAVAQTQARAGKCMGPVPVSPFAHSPYLCKPIHTSVNKMLEQLWVLHLWDHPGTPRQAGSKREGWQRPPTGQSRISFSISGNLGL